jgi:hypothetical protein
MQDPGHTVNNWESLPEISADSSQKLILAPSGVWSGLTVSSRAIEV